MYLFRISSLGRILLVVLVFLVESLLLIQNGPAAQWTIPVAGNLFRTAPEVGNGSRRNQLVWKDSSEVFSIYFRVNRSAVLDLSIKARVPDGLSNLSVSFNKQSFKIELNGTEFAEHKIGQINVDDAGYCRIDLQGLDRTGDVFAEVTDLIATSTADGVELDYVKTNEGQMFYWGRRGPSVHLRYEVPRELEVEYAYSEITVPSGQDPIGSYFMANGFGEGYFGIQVNSARERRVLFSVWSSFKTDNPKDIPADQRIVPLDKGPEVKLGEFGNEGSGGQSYLVFPWQSGVTYRFLTQVKPDGEGNTVYACWFGEVNTNTWRLIARFRRPKTNTYLVGFHSFLENFDPSRGHMERRGLHGNVWIRDVEERWHECTSGRFSVDATGKGRHRLDYASGSEGGLFFLRNGGFFNDTVTPGSLFTRSSTAQKKPTIDFVSLP